MPSLPTKKAVVQYVGDVLKNLSPGSQLTMTIKAVPSEGFFVTDAISLSSDGTQKKVRRRFKRRTIISTRNTPVG